MVTPTRFSPPGSIHMVTHRTTQGEFLLRPDPLVNQNFLYILGYLQERHAIGFHTATFMSNHPHILLTDHLGDSLQRFNREFFSLTARSLNRYWGRSENLWSTRKPNCVLVAPRAEDIVDHAAYIIVNPVEAELVSHAKNWPGVRILASEMGRLELVTPQPEFFFDAIGGMPPETRVRFTLPKVWDATPEELRTRIEEECNRREQQIRERVKKENRSFAGAKSVKRRSPFSKPKEQPPFGEAIPHVACKEPRLYVAMLEWRERRQQRYRQLLGQLREGVRDVVFPEGTFALHFWYGLARREWGGCIWTRLAAET